MPNTRSRRRRRAARLNGVRRRRRPARQVAKVKRSRRAYTNPVGFWNQPVGFPPAKRLVNEEPHPHPPLPPPPLNPPRPAPRPPIPPIRPPDPSILEPEGTPPSILTQIQRIWNATRRKGDDIVPYLPIAYRSTLEPTFLIQTNEGANAPPSVNLDVGGFRNAGVRLGDPIADVVFNGFPTPHTDPRWPDPFTLVRTGVTSMTSGVNLTPLTYSGAPTYGYGTYFLFRGSPINSFWEGKVGTAGALKWKAADCQGSVVNAGINSSNYFTRPIGAVVELHLDIRGLDHSVSVCAVPFEPILPNTIGADVPTGFPATIGVLPTAAQVSFGAKQWVVTANDNPIRFCTLPMDSRALDFAGGNIDRTDAASYAMMAWHTWIVWIYGMSADDAAQVAIHYSEEIMPRAFVATGFNYPTADKESNSSLLDSAINAIQAAAEAGLTGYKVVDSIVNVGKKVWNMGKSLYSALGFANGTLPIHYMPLPHSIPMPSAQRKHLMEAKIDEEWEEAHRSPTRPCVPRSAAEEKEQSKDMSKEMYLESQLKKRM